MSNFKTVNQFLKEVPNCLEHSNRYRSLVADTYKPGKFELDLNAWEWNLLGVGERNILRDLNMPDKFRKEDFDEGFVLESTSWSKQMVKEPGSGNLKNEQNYDETFQSVESIALRSSGILLTDSRRPGIQIPDNEPLYRSLVSALSGLQVSLMSGVAMSFVGERLVCKTDLRRMFLKGYLMLMSYNLAVTSGRTSYEISDCTGRLVVDATPAHKAGYLMNTHIVVHEEHFTREELWLIIEMCNEYPKRRYGPANIYNDVVIEAEDLVIFCDKDFSIGQQPGYGSPERLWYDLVQVALKFDALNDLAEVVKDMRGLPGVLRSVNYWTRKNRFYIEYPESYSIRLGVTTTPITQPIITKYSGYFATSKSLVADLMLSEMMTMSAFNIIEETGGLGEIGVPTNKAATDAMYGSNLRTYGLKSDDETKNELLSEWRAVRGGKICVNMGGMLKKMVGNMTASINKGEAGFLRPQLLFSLPYSNNKNTTWGIIRGWKFPEFNFTDDKKTRMIHNGMLKGFTWVMGVSKDVPKVGANALGQSHLQQLSEDELKFINIAKGPYELQLVRHRIVGELLARVDEIEEASDQFYSTSFPGVRCTIIFDVDGKTEFVAEQKKPSDFEVISLIGGKDAEDGRPLTLGGSELRKDGGISTPVEDDLLDSEGTEEFDTELFEEGKEGPKTKEDTSRKKKDDKEEEKKDDEELPKQQDRNKPARSEVVIQPGGKLNFNSRPSYERGDDGEVKAPMFNVHGIGQMKIAEFPNKYIPRKGDVNGFLVEVAGDGKCGVHAVIENLAAHGFIRGDEKLEMKRDMVSKMESTLSQDAMELAEYVNTLGMGMVLVDGRSKSFTLYGTRGAYHNVWLWHKGDNHWSTFVPHSKGNTKLRGYAVREESLAPMESLRAIRAIREELGGSWLNRDLDRKEERLYFDKERTKQPGTASRGGGKVGVTRGNGGRSRPPRSSRSRSSSPKGANGGSRSPGKKEGSEGSSLENGTRKRWAHGGNGFAG